MTLETPNKFHNPVANRSVKLEQLNLTPSVNISNIHFMYVVLQRGGPALSLPPRAKIFAFFAELIILAFRAFGEAIWKRQKKLQTILKLERPESPDK